MAIKPDRFSLLAGWRYGRAEFQRRGLGRREHFSWPKLSKKFPSVVPFFLSLECLVSKSLATAPLFQIVAGHDTVYLQLFYDDRSLRVWNNGRIPCAEGCQKRVLAKEEEAYVRLDVQIS